MSDDLDALLGGLGNGPIPPLVAAELVRRRGEQRRRRRHVTVGLAGAFVAVAIGGTAYAFSTGVNDPDALQYATPTPTSAPSPSPSPSPTSSCGTVSPGVEECPDATEPPVTGENVPATLLVQPEDAAAVAGGSWRAGATNTDASFALLSVCPTVDVGGISGTSRDLSSASTGIGTQVIRYPDGTAAGTLRSLRDDVRRCPSRPGDAEGATTVTHGLEPASASDTVVVRETRMGPGSESLVSYWVAVADLSHVSYLSLPSGERPRLAAWADAARFRLTCGGSCARGSDQLGAEPGPLAADDRLRLDGIGPVVVGMTLAEAQAAAGQPFTTFKDDLGNGCGFVSPRSSTPRISLMVVDGIVIRIDVDTKSTRTTAGVGVGSTEQQVKDAYPGRVVVLPHDYTNGHYLRVTSADGRRVLVFETDGSSVTSLRSGTADAAGYNEGCA